MRRISTLTITMTLAISGSIAGVLVSAFTASGTSRLYLVSLLVAGGASIVAAATTWELGRLRKHEPNPGQIFIIYRRTDLERARELSDWLRDSGYSPWLDVEDLSPGENWKEAITTAMGKSNGALVIVSREAGPDESTFEKEISQAFSTIRSRTPDVSPVIPVMMGDEAIPESLRELHAVDFRDPRARSKLASSLSQLVSLPN